MASSKKQTAKQFAQSKRRRRQWITFVRMCRYGVNNFSRNAWLTIAATAVMTVTLLIVFATLAARNTLASSVDNIRESVDMSIYVKTDISEENVSNIRRDLEGLSTVTAVRYVTPEQSRQAFAEREGRDAETLDAIIESSNQNPGIFNVQLVDINDTSQLRRYTETSAVYKDNADPNRDPSFAGERKSAIEGIAQAVVFAERAGLVATVVFVVISSLIVFNTIRMAIFNRRDEIEMMKLIGADKNFIRGPFIVEAVVYGVIAAVLATIVGILGLLWIKDKLIEGIEVQPTIDFVTVYIGFVLLGMIVLGGIIGVFSSLLATRRYLKI